MLGTYEFDKTWSGAVLRHHWRDCRNLRITSAMAVYIWSEIQAPDIPNIKP